METALIAKIELQVNAPVSTVWDGLTNPDKIKKYLFGTEAVSDWKKGSTLIFRGEWEGKQYEDRGTIKEIIPNKILHYTYWSSMSGSEDKPENYANIIYEVEPSGSGTKLTITQDNIPNEERKEKAENDWNFVLKTMKDLMEKGE
jgi:uncharacterized protein YndB with AHSA1/START domain